ncbi:DUF3221 domain-containing protein [Lederbergia graminis]
MLAVILTACNTKMTIINTFDTEIQPPTTYKHSPKPYVKGIEDIEVYSLPFGIDGYDEMETFYEDTNNEVPSKIRLLTFNVFGTDVVDLNYNGEDIEIVIDNIASDIGAEGITTITCENIIKETNKTRINFFATGCPDYPNGTTDLLEINFDLKRYQFDFQLMYGEKLVNEINTWTNTITENNEIQALTLPTEVKQEVLKRLIFQNLLEAEGEFYTTCSADNINSYKFIMGEREFYWNNCDHSRAAIELTNIAEYIIQQAKQKHDNHSELIVQGYIIQVNEDSLVIGENLNILEYKQIQQGIQDGTLDAYLYDFLELQDINTKKFKAGDKIQATIGGEITEGKPSIAKVKKIELIEKPILE